MAKAKAAPRVADKPKGGRPSLYTPELVEAIAGRVEEGTPLAEICREEGMPGLRTVYDWIAASPEVSARFARAREAGYDQIALDALKIADHTADDYTETEDGALVLNHEHVQRSKLRIETRLKLLAKWDHRRYGDKQTLAGDPESPLVSTTDEQLDARIKHLLGATK